MPNQLKIMKEGNYMFEQLFNVLNEFNTNYAEGGYPINADIIENEKEFTVLSDLPGFDKKDVKISFEKGYLNVSAERTNNEKTNYVLNNRPNKYVRSFYFDDQVEPSTIKATMENGVLTVTLAKKEKVSTEIVVE